MVSIQLKGIAKRYRNEWIFRGIDHNFEAGNSYALLGNNGSGKSTLLKVIAGSLTPSKGDVNYTIDGKAVEVERIYQYIGWAAPYMDLVEELSFMELLRFHTRFKPLLPDVSHEQIAAETLPNGGSDRQIRQYSSGMKQRAKLALAFYSNTPILLLDEPLTNLDAGGANWYRSLIERYSKNRLLIIASNRLEEYDFCQMQIKLEDYKVKG